MLVYDSIKTLIRLIIIRRIPAIDLAPFLPHKTSGVTDESAYPWYNLIINLGFYSHSTKKNTFMFSPNG
jgi:hypothetical protein